MPGPTRTRTWHQRSHITGPSAVLVSISFGTTPDGGPTVIKIVGRDVIDATVKFDVDRHVAEIISGVARANAELDGALQVEAIQIVPDDYPSVGQAEYVAYVIAKEVMAGG